MSIIIETNDGRYKAGAKLSVENPEVLDDWPESRRNVFVKNKEVSVCVGNSDGWLCVAKLPLSYSEEDFVHLAGLYGKVREAFLMISEKTGIMLFPFYDFLIFEPIFILEYRLDQSSFQFKI